MITFKVVKLQHFSLSFIIYVCGLKKELLREKLPQRNSESWFGIGHSDQVRKARFFDLCSFIIPLSVCESCLCFSWSFLSPSPLFIALFFFWLSVFLSLHLAIWDPVPAYFTPLTRRQMVILIIVLAEISLWSILMLRIQPLHLAWGKGEAGLVKVIRWLRKGRILQDKSSIQVFLMPNILHAVKALLELQSS